MTLFWYLTLVVVLLIWGAIRIWVADKRAKVFNHREFYKIRENLVRVKNTILFKYFLNKYLKDFYKVGKEKWYHDTYTIFEKKSNKPVVKWEIYTNNLYSWKQVTELIITP